MKLPEIRFTTPVQSFGRQNPNLPLSKAKRTAAAMGLLAQSAASASEIAAGIYDREVKMEVENGQAVWQSVDNALKEEHYNKTTYESNELDDDMRRSGFAEGPEQPTEHAYKYRAEILKRKREEALEKIAPTIRDADAQRNFRVATEKYIGTMYGAETLAGAKEQVKVHRKTQGEMIDEYVRNGEYDSAIILAHDFEGTLEEKNAIVFKIEKTREEDPMRLAITQGDVVAMEKHLAIMKSEPDDYDGALTQKERMEWEGKLDRGIWQEGKSARELKTANDSILKMQGKNVRDALKYGYDIPLERATSVMNSLIGVDNVLALQIETQIVYQKQSAMISQMPHSQRLRVLEEARVEASKNERSALLHKQVSDAVAQQWKDQNADSATYGNKTGLTEAVKLDMQNLGESLTALNINDKKVQSALQFDTTGIFTKGQATEFAKYLSTLTPDKLAATFGVIEGALGEDSRKVYEQLKSEGLNGTVPIAGQVYASGDTISSGKLAEGRRLRKEYPNMFKAFSVDINDAIDDALSDTYKDKKGQHELMREAVKDAYAEILLSTGGDVSPDSLEETTLMNAVATATGGLIEMNGHKVEPAYRGQPQEEMDAYVDNIRINQLGRMGVPIGMTLTQLRDDMHDEKIEYKNVSEGEYYLFHRPTNQYVRDKQTGGPFIFKYITDFGDLVPEVVPYDPRKKAAIEQIEQDRVNFNIGFDEMFSNKEAIKRQKEIINSAVEPLF